MTTTSRMLENDQATRADIRPVVICVHQGHELYGSDRSFVDVVRLFADQVEADFEVVLPRRGPIERLFAGFSGKVRFANLFVLRKSTIIRSLTTRLPNTIAAIRCAVSSMRRAETTYVNTCVVLDYLIAGWLTRRNLVVHVREIPTGIAMRLIRFLLLRSGAKLIYNSLATKTAFAMPVGVEEAVVWNGFADPGEPPEREPFAGRAIRVLCIGRINGWKGQDDLVEAVAMLGPEERRVIEVRIVGGVFEGQTHFLDRLNELISRHNLEGVVRIQSFTQDPLDAYRWADLVVVPSRLPEPFGRVAIEAMAHGCAVIATAQGGLVEIVKDGETGILVAPKAPERLADVLRQVLANPDVQSRYGKAGRQRFLSEFTVEKMNLKALNCFCNFYGNRK